MTFTFAFWKRCSSEIRLKEQKLNLKSLAPLPAMMKLFDFTYEHFASNPLFIRILTNENLLDGRYLSRSVRVSSLSSPLLVAMKEVLRRGEAEEVFRRGIDPLQLYVSMVAMSYFHISNGPTLSHLFSANLSAGRWRNERRRHAGEMLEAYLTSGLEIVRLWPEVRERAARSRRLSPPSSALSIIRKRRRQLRMARAFSSVWVDRLVRFRWHIACTINGRICQCVAGEVIGADRPAIPKAYRAVRRRPAGEHR